MVEHIWFIGVIGLKINRSIDNIEEKLGYSVFVKPANLGSSIGISKANDREGLIEAIEIAIRYDRKILVEKAIENPREINCAVMGYDEDVIASLCEEPVGWEEILSFEDKYIRSNTKGGGKENSRRIIPADIEDDIRRRIEDIAKKSFISIDCSGNARVDFLLDNDNNIFINEINTLPGSVAFYLWEDKGYPFKELIDRMIEIAIEVHKDKEENMYFYEADLFNRVHLGSGKTGKA